MPDKALEETYSRWAQQYGDMVYVKSAGQPIVILNDVTLADEIFEKKGPMYSDRASFLWPANSAGLKQMRKYIHRAIGTRSELEKHAQLLEAHALGFLKALNREPENLEGLSYNRAIIILLTYGYEVLEKGDPFINLANVVMEDFNEVINPGAYLVDLILLVSAFTRTSGFRYAAKVREGIVKMTEDPFKWTKNEMSTGKAVPSLVSLNMEGRVLDEEEEHCLKWAAASLFAGGSDTAGDIPSPNASTLLCFFFAMTLYPDAQSKAQTEIDRAIGSDRLPTLADRDNLPYVNALFSELIRWAAVTPIEQDPRICAFGFGRRICPGRQFADTVAWLTIAATLSVFRVSKVTKDGVEVTPSVQFTGIAIRHPVDFECDIKPRSARAEQLILQF
ncbi:cytochrome P450 [Gloeopeniophorella convolvens]|nr:cytochrome P450 [Gloeopeniophorella convolvens]